MYGYEVRESECKAMTECTGVKWLRVSVYITVCAGMKCEVVKVRVSQHVWV